MPNKKQTRNVAAKIRDIATADLIPNPRNAKKHDDIQVAKIAGSIKEFGFGAPIITDGDNGILAGHGRWLAAQKLGLAKVPCVEMGHLSDTQRRAYMLADNRLAEIGGGWDMDILKIELEELSAEEIDLDALGFGDEFDIDLDGDGEGGEDVDAEPQIDKAEELREKWGVELGQLWEMGDHRIFCGDSTKAEDVERVMGGEKADAIIADLPYGMRLDADFSGMKNNLRMAKEKGLKNGKKYENVIGDHSDFDAAPVILAFGNPQDQFWFGADYYADSLPDTQHTGAWLVWDKRLDDSADKMFGSCFELCWSMRKCKRDIIRIKWAGVFGTEKEPQRGRQHPNQKPVALLVDIINRTEGVIADPFSGSGTTIIACEQLGRKCRAIEISPAYVAVAIQRWTDATGKEPRKL